MLRGNNRPRYSLAGFNIISVETKRTKRTCGEISYLFSSETILMQETAFRDQKPILNLFFNLCFTLKRNKVGSRLSALMAVRVSSECCVSFVENAFFKQITILYYLKFHTWMYKNTECPGRTKIAF